jgi:hypothetical protein
VDPYKAREDVTDKILLEELEAQANNSGICDGETDRTDTSDNEYVLSEHSYQEESDHVSTPETDSDGDDANASGFSYADSETEAKNGQIWNKLPPLVSHARKHNMVTGKLRLTAYSENVSSLAKTLKPFITDDILNEIRHHTNAEDSFRIPKLWKDIRRALCFLGFVHSFWRSSVKKETSSTVVDHKRCLCQTDFSCNDGNRSVLSNSSCNSFDDKTEINRQISSNQKCV